MHKLEVLCQKGDDIDADTVSSITISWLLSRGTYHNSKYYIFHDAAILMEATNGTGITNKQNVTQN